MPYLSRVYINPLRPKGRDFLANPQIVHAAVLGAFAEQPVSERVLWRMDVAHSTPQGLSMRGELLVLTQSRPSFEHIIEQAGYPGADGSAADIRDYSPLLERINIGREFEFKLRANPVTSTKNPVGKPSQQKLQVARSEGKKRGIRVPHVTVDQQLAWLMKKVENSQDPPEHKLGFELVRNEQDDEPMVILSQRERLSFLKSASGGDPKDRGSKSRRVTIQTATFTGLLRVTDAEIFQKTLLNGIGPAKAYGCGLLTVAAPRATR